MRPIDCCSRRLSTDPFCRPRPFSAEWRLGGATAGAGARSKAALITSAGDNIKGIRRPSFVCIGSKPSDIRSSVNK